MSALRGESLHFRAHIATSELASSRQGRGWGRDNSPYSASREGREVPVDDVEMGLRVDRGDYIDSIDYVH